MDMRKAQTISPEQRQLMISEAAFYRAESHGFQGDPVADWLQAEVEIDSILRTAPEHKRKAGKKASAKSE